ncbi:MAG TPA: mycothiol system anti-sigma-R factor [Candidatus Dormibacteraeota bacterium]|jgi:mycothiol system anti-sigma-R factor
MSTSDDGCVNCAGAMDKLHSYVDRELTEVELSEVRRHLEDCPPCQRHFDFEVQLKLLVHRKACPETAPQHLLTKVLGNLKRA